MKLQLKIPTLRRVAFQGGETQDVHKLKTNPAAYLSPCYRCGKTMTDAGLEKLHATIVASLDTSSQCASQKNLRNSQTRMILLKRNMCTMYKGIHKNFKSTNSLGKCQSIRRVI